MQDHYFFPIFGVLLIIAFMVIAMIRSHLSATRKLRLRAIQKEERLKAIEAGVPLPEVDEPIQGVTAQSVNPESFARQVLWLRLVSLASGCFMVFAGIGMYAGFMFSRDRDLQEIAALGFLPALAGLGLLLFFWLTRKQH